MGLLGGVLMFLAMPLLIGHALSNKQNPMRLRLGLLLMGVGLLIVVAGKVTGL